MTLLLKAYLAVAVPLLVADGAWLGVMTKRFYRPALGALMARRVKLAPAALFYLAYPLGLAIFAVQPALGVGHAAGLGGLFGLFCYGTYDLVNHSTLDGWPIRLTVVDMSWGTTLSAAASALAFVLLR